MRSSALARRAGPRGADRRSFLRRHRQRRDSALPVQAPAERGSVAGAAQGVHALDRRCRGGCAAGARVPAAYGPRDAGRDDRRVVERAGPAARGGRDRGLQAARRRVRGGEPRAPRRHSRALSRLAPAGGRRRRRREPQGLSDRGEQRAHDPQRRQQPHAVPGRVGRGVDQALAHVLGRLQPRLRARLRLRAASTASWSSAPICGRR